MKYVGTTGSSGPEAKPGSSQTRYIYSTTVLDFIFDELALYSNFYNLFHLKKKVLRFYITSSTTTSLSDFYFCYLSHLSDTMTVVALVHTHVFCLVRFQMPVSC